MNTTYLFTKQIKDDQILRKSFNDLTEMTFGFRFDTWYELGYWGEKYITNSYLDQQQVIANVSVNKIPLILNGEKKRGIQIGTVMTNPLYQRQGLAKRLMESVIKEYKEQCDIFYLFANPNATGFYEKLGFHKIIETQYIIHDYHSKKGILINQLDMNQPLDKQLVLDLVYEHIPISKRISMIDNPELIMFYLTSFLRENIYYIPSNESIVIASIEDRTLMIYDIFCKKEVALMEVIDGFHLLDYNKVIFGFTPEIPKEYLPYLEKIEIRDGDTITYVYGKSDDISGACFPILSHA